MAADDVIRFLDSPGTSLEGLPSEEEALALVKIHYPAKPYCIVEQWQLLELELTAEEIANVKSTGQLPLFLFAHSVLEDSEGRFERGYFVRSSMCKAFVNGVLFETRNTVYVLVGPGHKKFASLRDVFSIF